MDKKSLPSNTYYKRNLPPTCIAFNSEKGKTLFRGALEQQFMESYFGLSLQFLTQAEPAYCGLGSLCMVLNALQVDPMRQWKGCWRWYDETMLDCCPPLDKIRENGITLPEFTCLAKCNGLSAVMKRSDQITKEDFLEDIKRTSALEEEYMVVSFCRKTLGQTGSGHFSPVGGYNAITNSVLILDVARFKYPAYWVSLDCLWDSLLPLDESTQRPRGYAILCKGNQKFLNLAFSQLSLNCTTWPELHEIMCNRLPETFSSLNYTCIEEYVSLIVTSIPDHYNSILNDRTPLFIPPYYYSREDLNDDGVISYLSGLDTLLQQVTATELHKLVMNSLASKRKIQRVGSFSNLYVSSETSTPPVLNKHESFMNDQIAEFINHRASALQHSNQSCKEPQHNDFIAFLTIFFFSLFSIYPIHQSIRNNALQENMKTILDISALPDPLATEVKLLREQIIALDTVLTD